MERRQRHHVLIVARSLAEVLATPIFITDARGDLVFYNEAAEPLLGRSFAEAGPMPAQELASMFKVKRLDGTPMELGDMPVGSALLERLPAHRTFRITDLGGVERVISATGIPLFSHPDDFVGVIVIFWEGEKEQGR